MIYFIYITLLRRTFPVAFGIIETGLYQYKLTPFFKKKYSFTWKYNISKKMSTLKITTIINYLFVCVFAIYFMYHVLPVGLKQINCKLIVILFLASSDSKLISKQYYFVNFFKFHEINHSNPCINFSIIKKNCTWLFCTVVALGWIGKCDKRRRGIK